MRSLCWRALPLVVLSLRRARPATAADADQAVVSVPSLGTVRGLASVAGTDAFLGIRYAKPPVGALRYAVAQAAAPWGPEGFNATAYSPICQQTHKPNYAKDGLVMGEDCLSLNIWRPAGTTHEAALPIMFWIHGGGFTSGTGADREFNGTRLARQHGLMVVTINYRLGALGFLPLEGGIGKGSGSLNAVYDQIMALKWVRAHIKAFGGDPEALTVAGESAGSLSVCMLSVSPLAAGLFRAAIMESGSCIRSSAWAVRPAYFSEAKNTAAALRALSAPDVIKEYSPDMVIDGWVLPQLPGQLIAEGKINCKKFLMGGNSFDGLQPWFPPELMPTHRLYWVEYMNVIFGAYGYRMSSVMSLMAHYHPSAFLEGFLPAAVIQADGDATVFCPTKWIANDLHEAGAEVFLYHYAFGPNCNDKATAHPAVFIGPYVEAGGWASHASEMMYVFGSNTWSVADSTKLCTPYSTNSTTKVTEAMQSYWSAFVRGGAPNATGLTPWERFNTASRGGLTITGDAKASTISFLPGVKDPDCDVLQTLLGRGWVAGCVISLVLSVAALGALCAGVTTKRLAHPRQAWGQRHGSCCNSVGLVTAAAATLCGLVAALCPWVAPYSAGPLVLGVAAMGAMLSQSRAARWVVALCIVVLGYYVSAGVIGFSVAAWDISDHAKASAVACSGAMLAFLVLPCALGCAARRQDGFDGADFGIREPFMGSHHEPIMGISVQGKGKGTRRSGRTFSGSINGHLDSSQL